MYKTIIKLNNRVSANSLISIGKAISEAFSNRAGRLVNKSNSPYEFLFESDESGYGCLELGTLAIRDNKTIVDNISSWDWIDDDPDESCDMLEVFERYAV